MGVPKFYRWISERYPKINQIVSDNALLPEFDHLYLDMNGIIHGCTHPAGMDLADGLSERDMMLGIMHYLDRIISQIVKPKVSVYMAIDGVAPRAKLNQQRSRRFRSAKDMAEATKDMKSEPGQTAKAVFDSNCITPGTEFLAQVSITIQYFIRKKIKEDPAWRGLSVIFSGHDIPGEGEHKIMQHIREMRADPNYQPNTRHCIYGQDADLIMLGLVTHEPHFTILREVVDFGGSFNNNKNTLKAVKKFTKESDFQLLHLSVLREYLNIEFVATPQMIIQQHQGGANDNPYNLERCIDDFVFLTFLVGNDFLPHMPTLDIGDGAFDLLFNIYKEQRHSWGVGQYLTERGEISDPARLEIYLAAIGAVESDILEQREIDDVAYTKKRRQWDKRDGKEESGPSDAVLHQMEEEKQNDYHAMIQSMLAEHSPHDFVDGWTPVSENGGKDFKGRYYYEKMKMTPVHKDKHWALRRSYMEGLRWCLAYYYKGCISWGWFYPYHYGPMLSDLKNIPQMFAEIKFEVGEPLTPFQQLMGCLPPASATLVPKLYRWLMSATDSPIVQFYPPAFDVDMNGKKNPWEGVNLLPFIDIQLLKDTIATHCPSHKLSANERIRNSIGKVYCYKFDKTCTELVPSPSEKIGLPDIAESYSSVTTHDEKLGLSKIVFEPSLIAGTQIPYPGFPSLNVLPIASSDLTSAGLNCFGFPSKYPNVILTMHQMPELPPIETLAENVIGKSLFVNWPMMHEARVVAVSDRMKEVRIVDGNIKSKEHTKVAADSWSRESLLMTQTYHVGNGFPGSGGLQIGDINVRLKLLPLQGMKTNISNGSTKKVFGNEEADIPLQLALWQAPIPDPRFIERGPMTLQDRFPLGCNVILTKGKSRGCKGTVVAITDQKSVGVKVMTMPPEIPFGLAIARSVQEVFISSSDAARVLKMNPGVFGKIMGWLPFEQGRYDLGLNLKSSDGLCVVGYTRRRVESIKNKLQKNETAWTMGDAVLVIGSRAVTSDSGIDERIQWEYTPQAIRLVDLYRSKFPQLFDALNRKPNERKYDAYDVFGKNGEAWLPVVREWLDKHESAKLPRSPVTTESMSYEAATTVQTTADLRSLATKKLGFPKEVLIKIPGSALYREGSTGATDILLSEDLNQSDRPELGERVVNLCADGVPFGARGTIIAIHEAATSGSVEVLMDEEFIGGTSLQGHCANFRGKLCHWSHLLKVTPGNGKGLVEKLVPVDPKNSVESILLKSTKEAPVRLTMSQEGRVDAVNGRKAANVSTPARPISSGADRAKSRTPPRSSTRAGSTGRTRLVAWKEARGPDDNGIGFSGSNRKEMNGLMRWKKTINSRSVQNQNAVCDVEQTAKDLKAMLGINPTVRPSAADELKAVLGVTTKPKVQTKPANFLETVESSTTNSVSDGLKALLGVGGPSPSLTPSVQVPQPPAFPPTAAGKLLQLLSEKQPQVPQDFGHIPPMPSSFNFTYVEVGKEIPNPPTPHAVPAPLHVSYHMSPYGGYSMPSLGGPHPPPTAFAGLESMMPPVTSSAPLDQFPPLNGVQLTPIDAVPASATISSASPSSTVTRLRPSSVLLPGVVKEKR